MSNNEVDILKKALARERQARKEAEKILEEKSRELYTLSRKLKHDLNETTTELEGVFDNLVDAYVLMDIKGNVVKMNQTATALFGYDIKSEKVNVLKLIYKEDMPYAMKSFYQLIKEGSFSDYQARVNTKNNGVRNVHINASVIKDEKGTPIAAQGIVRDITQDLANEEERKQLIQNLKHKNQDLNDFAHIVSHDLKSPLRGMDTLINWLREDYAAAFDEKADETFTMLLNKVSKMDSLIDGILKYSSIDKKAKGNESVNLNTLVNEIIGVLHLPENVSISTTNELPIIKGDTSRLQQLFQNLLNNAVNSIDKAQGVITITTQEQQTHWQFSITDNGKGIADAYKTKIFEIFESLEDNERSTGIGLSIVKKIVQFYEGEIWLDSQVGVGTSFHFTLKKY